MSQFEAPPQHGDALSEPPRTSGLAVGSLICSLVFCCPITTVLGVLLGLAAFFSISANPARRGKGLAVVGLLLGIVFTAGQAFVANKAYQAYVVFRDAPGEALSPGFAGDYAAMRSSFGTGGLAATDAEAEAFVQELRQRYGELQRSDLDLVAYQTMQQPQPGQTEFTMPWLLIFDNATINAELTFSESTQGPDDRIIFDSITVYDPDQGDLAFPAATTGGDPSAASGDVDTGGTSEGDG
ncbi:MAG: DUF4190 domain-containing protein [Planctomycetota bacterium]|jgi:hypothetical protein